MSNKKIILILIISIILTFGLSISFQSLLASWTAPTEIPPDGNVPALLNTSSTGQAKQGGLILNTSGAAENGLIIQSGNVGIGTINPNAKLTVEGEISLLKHDISYSPSATSGYGKLYFKEGSPGDVDVETKLLIHSDTTDGSTIFTDFSDSTHIITPYGQTHHEIDQSKFGDTSIYFDGLGDYLSVSDSDDWYFGSGDFTIDTWVYFNSLSEHAIFISQYINDSNYTSFGFINTTGFVFKQVQGGVVLINLSQGNISGWNTDTWYHVAIVRNGNIWNLYRNGISIVSTTNSNNTANYASSLRIGMTAGSSQQPPFFIDELRISKGTARWTTNFTPELSPYGAEIGLYFKNNEGTEISLAGGSGGSNSPWGQSGSNIYYSSGNVGINTNSPDHELVIKDINGSSGLYVWGSGQNAELALGDGTDHWAIYSDEIDTDDLRFWRGDNKMVITDDGNVGIGIDDPASKLDISGGEIKVGNSGADCSSSNEGAIRYNSTSKKVEYCDGSGWQEIAQGIGGNDVNTKLLLHMNSGLYEDDSMNAYMVTNHDVTNGTGYWGGAGLMDTDRDYLQVQDEAFNLGTGDFTIDFWVKVIENKANYVFYSTGGTFWLSGVLQNLTPSFYCAGTSYRPDNNSFLLNTWTHIAYVRQEGVMRIFINGINKKEFSCANDIGVSPTYGVSIGAPYPWYGNYYANMYIDEFRVSNIARWWNNFSVLLGPYD